MLIDCDRETYGKFIRSLQNATDKPTSCTTFSVMQTSVNGKLVAQAIYNHAMPPRYQIEA
jgi:hypothetical protein